MTPREREAFMRDASHEQVMTILEKCSMTNLLPPNMALALVNRKNHDEIMYYIQKLPLWSKAEAALFQLGDKELILTYVRKRSLFRPGEEALIKRGQHDEIMAYLENHGFTSSGLKFLIERGNTEEITAAAKFSFGPDVENFLIEHGVHEQIMAYIALHPLFSDPQEIALVQRGNPREIDFYQKTHGFRSEAQKLLNA